MAVSPLLVRLCPAPDAGEKVLLKLQSYFQSGKRSGGGECEVRAGPVPNTYWVLFQQEQDKKSVESRTDHVVEIGARHLKVVIQRGEGDLSKSQFTKQAFPSCPILSGSSPPAQQEQQAAKGHGDPTREVITKKIFLTVSATLNTSMFTEHQRKRITIICPNLKREGNPDIDGSEKLTGDFADIEKAYCYFKDILSGNEPNLDFSHSESKNGLKDENGLNTEEVNDFTVPSALYEYFSHTCKEQIKELCERFGVCIISKDQYNGNTSVSFISDRSPALIQQASDFFIRTFQKNVENLRQEELPIANSYTLSEIIVKLNAKFSNILAKEEGNLLLLRGPASEILAAKKILAEEGENSQAEKNLKISSELYKYRNGIEVDASMFKLLETILSKEIEGIKDKFDTTIEKRDVSYDQKMLIIFRPRIKTFDMSSHATECFINAFQSAFAMLREKLISLKLSEGQKKRLNMLLNGKQLENLHVKLKKEEDKLMLIGLPNHLSDAEKYIMNFLPIEDSTQSKNRTPLTSDLSYQEDTGASEKKYNGRQKNNLTSEGQAKAKTEENDKDTCPICMEIINNKETLRKCKHAFCRSCIDQAMTYKQACPICNTFYGVMRGDQPEGRMSSRILSSALPGYPSCGTIEITYNMRGGIQTWGNHVLLVQQMLSHGMIFTTKLPWWEDLPRSCEKLEVKKASPRKSVIVVTAASGEEIEDEIVEMYFENKKKSGGGTIKSYVKKDQQMIITFQDEEDAQNVLQRKHHSVKKIDLFVKPWQVDTLQEPGQVEDSQRSLPSARVVLENVQETVKDCMLILLVENISGLSEDDGDFSVEMIPEVHAAVVTFTGNIAAGEFVEKFNQNHRAKEQNITARCLELTKSIRAENIPPNIPSDHITIYFENKKSGGGHVEDVQQLPDEDAAIITFNDHKDVTNILAKKHSLNKTPIFVYPFYTSLGTALYGKEGPQIKKPDPIILPLDSYIWYYLLKNNRLIETISCEMAKHNCALTWPEPCCADPKVTLHPSATLSEQKRSVSRVIKTWNENVSTAFSDSISKYKAIKCQVSAEVWEAIRNSFTHGEYLIIPYISKDLLVLVGEKEVVKNVEQELTLLMEKATRKIEREKKRTEEIVLVSPGEYAILQSTGLEEKSHTEFPALQINYDPLQKIINLCGMPEEVYKVKGEILENIHKMVKKTVNVHPYIFQFLEHIDNETLSQSLFMTKQISAFYELCPDAIILKANAPEDLLKAEEEIKKELVYKSITLEDESVLQKQEWRMLTKENCSNEAVTVTQAQGQVIIAGCSQAVEKAFEELFSFIDKNTQVQKFITGKPMAVINFFEKEKTSVWGELQNKDVKVDFITQKKCRVISLSGPRKEVLKGVTLVEQILSGFHYKRVVIREPGAKSYFKEREHFFAASAKQEFECLVRLEEQSEEQLEEQQGHSNVGKPYGQVTIGGVVVAVYEDDLCTHPVDVVVNASNEDLKHNGGVAWALLNAAGPEIQQECDELVKKSGSLQPGCVVITGAGKLPCKNIIHAVGPRWRKDEAEQCVCLLRQTVKRSLQLAETFHHHSIALPAISGGIFGFPLELCTYSIVASIKETLKEYKGDISLKEIHLVDIEQNKIQAFSKALGEVFSDYPPFYTSLRWTSTVHQPRKRKISQNNKNFQLVTTEEGLDIMLKEGRIEDATTDIVVISVTKDLQLDKGPLSKALLSKAGPMLQRGLKEEGLGKTPEEGSVLKTKGYNLSCSVVLHAVVPAWLQGYASTKVLGDIITKCLEIAEELSLKSITFPAIGTGNLGFPRSVVAKLLFDKVFEFSSKNGVNYLEEVHFLLHPKDIANIQEFSDELKNRCGNAVDATVQKTSPSKTSQDTAFSGTSSMPAQNVHEMTIGSIVFQVAEGDITKEEGDVIVNITNQTFSLKIGVSRAILNSAGKAVEDECAQLASQANKSYITTQAGRLPCKKIIHFVAQDDIKMLVSTVLQECEYQQYTSVAFPAIGTGQAGRDAAAVAEDMLGAVTDFARSNSAPYVKTVKVVIFQPHLLSVFHTSMQKRENSAKTAAKLQLSKLKSFQSSENLSPNGKAKAVLKKKIELAVVQICGESKKKVEETEDWLRSAILKEQFQAEITDEFISDFVEEQSEKLRDLENKLRIALYLDGNAIRISGVAKDVWIAYSTIQDMIYRVKNAKLKESSAELLKSITEWKYYEKDTYVPFDNLTNMRLENAFLAKEKDISIIINEKKYTVNLEAKHVVDDQGKCTPIIRVDKCQESIVLPATWDDMENQRLKIVELRPETREYRDVQKRFLETCQSFKIERIERVQNPYLWKAYQIKKCEMDNKNGNKNNERHLFHGTTAQFGKGTYFAVKASYSANAIYSTPDMDGKKYMYLARVLVGEYSQGIKGSILPAAKTASNSTDRFDSSTDDVKQPSIFIIFHDAQAYPEYLITFTA
ncbi:protein mono-ADP-ribosyltransferase PARP14-like isoform X1 [Pezoporus wallicus]|uniref:protein mono-ADP-ribosyltransferase PARP14-like isoform X1 n=1 Tax=Pezoporus wallicus TaxID=35540 RepID=UPI0025509FAE|nr:protein mono-ADP-ribosyltransferase PARP14-like isoform X1 [Pezoporus wallicus]